MEAEYRIIASTTIELCWIQSLLHELFVTISYPSSIYYDNIRATYICANPVFHSRMKHITFDFHFVHDKIQNGELRVSYVSSSSSDQLVYVLNKFLSCQQFHLLWSKIDVSDGSIILREHIRKDII